MVTEPKNMDAREEKKINKKSFCGKVFSVLKQTYKACKQDHALGIGLIAVMITRLEHVFKLSHLIFGLETTRVNLIRFLIVWQIPQAYGKDKTY